MFLIAIFVGCMVLANFTIYLFGPWFSPINAFLLIGLDMVVRDRLHDKWKSGNLYVKMFLLILFSSAVTYLLNPAAGQIALASVAAFAAAMVVNTAVYRFIEYKKWMVRSNTSNVGGSAADSVVFPTLAFGTLMWEIIALQFICKVGGGLMWSFLFKKIMRIK